MPVVAVPTPNLFCCAVSFLKKQQCSFTRKYSHAAKHVYIIERLLFARGKISTVVGVRARSARGEA